MPAPAEYLQFLDPQRKGAQVPDSQIVTQGPFTSQLSQPYYRPQPVAEPGFGGPGHALLSFANKFLEGASEGRLRQFQQSEQTKKEHERNFDSVVQHIQDDPGFTKDFKEKALQDALLAKAGAAQGQLGKGKSDNPAVNLARGIFTSMVGPHDNKAHVDIGPEHVSNLISQMNDPANRFDAASAMATAQGQLNQAISDIKGAAVDSNGQAIPITREEIMAHPKVVAALQPLMKQGLDPYNMPPIMAALSAVPPRMSAKDQEELAAARARRAMYEGKTMPSGVWNYTNPDKTTGQAMIDFRADAQGNPRPFFTMTGQPVPADHPIMTTGRPPSNMNWSAGTRLIPDENGQYIEVPNVRMSGKGTPPPPDMLPGGAPPAAAGTPAPPVAAPTGATPTPAATPVTGTPTAVAPTAPPPGSVQAQVVQTANTVGVDPTILSAIAKQESGFNPAAVGTKGEVGVMQLMPDTAKALGVADPADPAQSIEGGARYFKQLLDKYNGDTTKALWAYNAGPGAVDSGKVPDSTKQYASAILADAAGSRRQPPATQPGTPAGSPGRGGTAAPPVQNFGRPTGIHKPNTAAATPDEDMTMTPEESAALSRQRAANPSLDLDAWDYMLEHRLNTRGMGHDVKPQVKKIKQTASQIANQLGLDAGEIYTRRAELKGNMAAFSKVTTQAAQIESFEGTLLKNAEVARNLSDAFKRGDIQMLNQVAAAFKTGKGDPEALNLAAQMHGLSSEWAKIMAGAVSSNGVAIKSTADTDAILAKGITDGQLNSLIDNVIIPDAHNRTSANDAEKAKLLAAIRGTTQKNATGNQNPNPGGYVAGHVYGGMLYKGGDFKNAASWEKVKK